MTICPTCAYRMTAMGCTITGRPFHWCPNCGTVRTCDGVEAVPDLAARARGYYPRGTRPCPDPTPTPSSPPSC